MARKSSPNPLRLSPRASLLQAALNAPPPEPNEAMKRAAQRYAEIEAQIERLIRENRVALDTSERLGDLGVTF